MPRVELDARLAELVVLDVLDVAEDGTLRLNAAFRDECVAAYSEDASCLGTVVQDRILARAAASGYACLDLDLLALAALEAAEPDGSEAQASNG